MSARMPRTNFAARGNCFIVKRRNTPRFEQEIIEYEPVNRDNKKRNDYLSGILANILIGLIFVGIAVWAFPMAFSRTAVEIERLRGVVGPGVQEAVAATIPDSGPFAEKRAAADDETPAAGENRTKSRLIALPGAVAREIFRERAFKDRPAGMIPAKAEAPADFRRVSSPNSESGLTLPEISGIACSTENSCLAMIDNTIYRVNDVIGNAVIEEITERRILIRSLSDPSLAVYLGI